MLAASGLGRILHYLQELFLDTYCLLLYLAIFGMGMVFLGGGRGDRDILVHLYEAKKN